jgi:hypothetical protein
MPAAGLCRPFVRSRCMSASLRRLALAKRTHDGVAFLFPASGNRRQYVYSLPPMNSRRRERGGTHWSLVTAVTWFSRACTRLARM